MSNVSTNPRPSPTLNEITNARSNVIALAVIFLAVLVFLPVRLLFVFIGVPAFIESIGEWIVLAHALACIYAAIYFPTHRRAIRSLSTPMRWGGVIAAFGLWLLLVPSVFLNILSPFLPHRSATRAESSRDGLAMNTQIVTDEANGFVLTIPQNWSVDRQMRDRGSQGKLVLRAGSKSPDDFMAVMVCVATMTDDQQTPREYVAWEKQQLVAAGGPTIVDEGTTVIDGADVPWICIDSPMNDRDVVRMREYHLISGHKMMLVDVAALSTDFSSAIKTLESVARTFHRE